jgi:hypothetical protein
LIQQNGIYDVSGHPEMKVRVYVYEPETGNSNLLPYGAKTGSTESRDALDLLLNNGQKTVKQNFLPCGPDPSSSAVADSAGWHLPTGNWTYSLNLSSVPSGVGSVNMPGITASAFGQWASTTFGKVTFIQGGNTSENQAKHDNQNIITWGKAPNTALAVTYTWYYTASGAVAETDTIMISKFPWIWSGKGICDSNRYDAQDILTHELGHWVGLDDEYTSAYINNTMYGYGAKSETKKNTLTFGDVTAGQSIYK